MVQDMLLMKANVNNSRTTSNKYKKLATTISVLLLFSHVSIMTTAWTSTTTPFSSPATSTTELLASKRGRGNSLPEPRRFSWLINSLRGGTENTNNNVDRRTASTVVASAASSGIDSGGGSSSGGIFRWTLAKAVQAVVVFVLAGVAEIGGGWLVWKAVREQKPWWWALAGSLVLVLYGFIPTLQPTEDFGRIYAVYGGFFITLSYAWGWMFDGMKIDAGDIVGGSLALAGVLVILFWPRK